MTLAHAKEKENEIVTPSTLIPDGVDKIFLANPYTGGKKHEVRKATIGATIVNIVKLNGYLSAKTKADKSDIKSSITVIDGLIPSLKTLGLFNLFNGYEWLVDDTQPGKIITGILYFSHYPQEIDQKVKARLLELKKSDLYKDYIIVDLIK